MAVLVTGGAGYIGSHTVCELLERNEEVVVVDNLAKGHRAAVTGGEFIKGDLRDESLLDRVFAQNDIEWVIHFAADSLVGESVKDPLKYYNNNVVSTLKLITKMRKCGVTGIVFSSTAATYGEPENIPILETDRTFPANPYGQTKLAVENALKWADRAYGLKYVSLRYFNASGAHTGGCIGEDHRPETHLIPLVLQVALGKRDNIVIFGSDYETGDGTCIRDYIHVTDLAQAHMLALDHLRNGGDSTIYNLGNGRGFSVKEVIESARRITGKPIEAVEGERRQGDPAVLIASSRKITEELNFKPRFDDLDTIVSTAWNWHSKNPGGFGE